MKRRRKHTSSTDVTPMTSVPLCWHRCALSAYRTIAIVSIGPLSLSPLKCGTADFIGGVYADDASVLCGNRIRGGSLGVSAAANAGGRSGCALSVFWPALEVEFQLWARAPLRQHFVESRAQIRTFVSFLARPSTNVTVVICF